MFTGSTLYSQVMHSSMSFRTLALVGVVALVTAFYQSTQLSAGLTVTTGLTPRQLVELSPFTF